VRIDRISTVAELDAERDRWEQLERRDGHATVFMTWKFFRAYIGVARHRVFVLALRDGDETVAYLPLAAGGTLFDRELFLGGNPTADYAGLLALPEREDEAVTAFADALIAEPWDAFNVLDISDPRLETLVQRLVAHGVSVAEQSECAGVSCELPDSWETYCNERISAKTRVNTLRVERRMAEALPGFRVSEPTAETLDEHIAAMIQVNHARWGGSLRNARRRYGVLFREAFSLGLVRMFVYWDGARPIAGATAFIDRQRSSFGLYMIGFDEEFEKLSPGKGIIGRAIRAAIEDGYRHFDFLRGVEPFKLRYATDEHVTTSYRVVRPGLRAAAITWSRPKLLALKLQLANIVYGPGRVA
jgi:CelD/BcsL family acetyltransferase involved in cellulose biosynthesis